MRPKISIIMPVYNVEKYIRASIDSVLAQTFTNFELIIVDDGSPDNCPSICDEYALSDKRIKVIHKKNGGLSSARNAGIEIAQGEYIQFLDSDDTIVPTALQQLINIIVNNDVDVVVFAVNIYTDGNKQIVKSGPDNSLIIDNTVAIKEQFHYLTGHSMWNYAWDKLYKKQLLINNDIKFNSFYDRVCEDSVFLLDLFPYINSIYLENECLHNYYIRENQSVVKKFIPDRFEKYYGRFLKTKELVENLPSSEKNTNLLYELYLQFNIWAYELLFHKDCRFSFKMRYQYIKDTFSIDEESEEFKRNAMKHLIKSPIVNDISKTTCLATQYIISRRYLMALMVHTGSLIKSKSR